MSNCQTGPIQPAQYWYEVFFTLLQYSRNYPIKTNVSYVLLVSSFEVYTSFSNVLIAIFTI
jgi:hypothetical protein